MNSALEGVGELPGDRLPIGSLMRNLSALLAMEYRRAPLPISADMVRWFAGRSGPEAVLELGSVVRRCLLLGDETLVLRELRRHAAGQEETVTDLSNGSRKSPGSVIDPGRSLNQEAEPSDPHSPTGRGNQSGLQLRMGVRARYRPARRGNS